MSPELARRILGACAIPFDDLRPLMAGAQSIIWDVHVRSDRFVLRIAAARPGKKVCYEAEFAIRQQLIELGGRVARPVATNRDVDAEMDVDWCLDERVEGSAIADELPRRACRELGETLAALHSLPVEGYGVLENRRDRLIGKSRSARAGILSRLERPWPFSGEALTDHPIASEVPELIGLLESLRPALLSLLDDTTGCSVNHSDLHHGQLPVSNSRLAALLDFGDAVAATPAWDVGSFGYFHGWEQTAHLMEAYTADSARRAELLEQGRLFAIVIALHHAGRAVTLSDPQRMHGALRYLRANHAVPDVGS